jgi:exosortase C (VPDSG-CTERM-specific)
MSELSEFVAFVRELPRRITRRHAVFMAVVGLTVGAFAGALTWLTWFSIDTDTFSYVLLIPFITLYLFYLDRNRPAQPYVRAGLLAPLLAGLAAAALVLAHFDTASETGGADYLALRIFGLVTLVLAETAVFFGARAFRRNLFPLLFLYLTMPLPTPVTDGINSLLQHGSADATYAMFKLTGTPVFRQDVVLIVPGLVLEVAEACSGIRSSLVLLITSLLCGYLFLRRPLPRVLLVLAVIPISVLRNSFRIVCIALLTIHVNPTVIEGPLHRRGGPVFFVLSLAVLFLVMFALRWAEARTGKDKGTAEQEQHTKGAD